VTATVTSFWLNLKFWFNFWTYIREKPFLLLHLQLKFAYLLLHAAKREHIWVFGSSTFSFIYICLNQHPWYCCCHYQHMTDQSLTHGCYQCNVSAPLFPNNLQLNGDDESDSVGIRSAVTASVPVKYCTNIIWTRFSSSQARTRSFKVIIWSLRLAKGHSRFVCLPGPRSSFKVYYWKI
jgi:hypothetical protein